MNSLLDQVIELSRKELPVESSEREDLQRGAEGAARLDGGKQERPPTGVPAFRASRLVPPPTIESPLNDI